MTLLPFMKYHLLRKRQKRENVVKCHHLVLRRQSAIVHSEFSAEHCRLASRMRANPESQPSTALQACHAFFHGLNLKALITSSTWEINDKNRLKASYAYNVTNLDLVENYDNFILTDFRNFNQGTQNFDQLKASSALLNYQLGNWSDQFFANTFIFY